MGIGSGTKIRARETSFGKGRKQSLLKHGRKPNAFSQPLGLKIKHLCEFAIHPDANFGELSLSGIIRTTVVFCDDIRQEGNGKHILIGVYSGSLTPIDPFPNVFYVSAFVRVVGLEGGLHSFSFRMIGTDGSEAAETGGEIHVDPNLRVTILALRGLQIVIGGAGLLKAELALDGAGYEFVDDFEILDEPTNLRTN